MKPSQQKLYDWYKDNSNWFDNIISIKTLDSTEVEIITSERHFIIGKRGALTQLNKQ